MSNTAFTHEIQEDGTTAHRVVLSLDSAEAAALGEVAGAAVDLSVIASDMVDERISTNAEAIHIWAVRATLALSLLEEGPDAEE